MPVLDTDRLAIDYLDEGHREGRALLLLHGWPDDRSTWDAVAPVLQRAGFRTIRPNLRGFGATRLHEETRRTGNSAMLVLDAIALLDGLGIERFRVAGHDWGSNMAEGLAVGWPDRVESIAMLSTPPRLGGMTTPPFWHAHRQWYHWFQVTRRGAEAVANNPKGFARIMWENWSPEGWFDEATFERVARSFENPDWVSVTIHSYRSRWGEAEADPESAWLEEKVKATQTLPLPALYVQGAVDGVNPPATSETTAEKFTGPFERVLLEGVGHFPTREAPAQVADHLIRHFS